MIEALDINQYLQLAFNDRPAGLWWLIYFITQAGSPLALSLLASVIFLIGKDKVKIFALVLAVGLFFSIVVADDIKDLVKRPRPEGAGGTSYLIRNNYSFPSGHALAAFLAATVLGAYYGRKYYIAGYTLALVVGLSRLYLGVHYPGDVLAGAIIGIAMGELMIYAAFRLGLCDNAGLLSPILKSAKATSIKYDTGAIDLPLSALGSVAIASSILLYYLDHAALAIIILAVAAPLIFLYATLSKIKPDRTIHITFILASSGIVAALSAFYIGAHAISLLAVAITYIAIITLTLTKSQMKKSI
jgi:undecaprenyl-diphosphatase